MTKNAQISHKIDILGLVNSSICLVHCIATPLLISMGIGFLTNPIVDYLFLIVSFYSIFKATAHQTKFSIALLLWVSFWGFLMAHLFHEDLHWLHGLEYVFAGLIIAGHLLNIRYCRKCLSNKSHEKSEK